MACSPEQMRLRIRNIVCFAIVLIAIPSLSLAESEAIGPHEHLASLYAPTIRDSLVSRITNSGISLLDAESKADAALFQYAQCTIEALGNIDNPASNVLLNSIYEGLSAEDLDTKLQEVDLGQFADFITKLNSLTTRCRAGVDAKLGIPAEARADTRVIV